MATSSKDINLYKLICIFMSPGTEAVVKKLSMKISNEYASFPDFLDAKLHDLFHLYNKFSCCSCKNRTAQFSPGKGIDRFQWQKLYIKRKSKCRNGIRDCSCLYSAMPQIQEQDLDSTLAISLLLNLFQLPEGEKQDLKNFRHYRNEYYAHLSTAQLEENRFLKMFNDTASTIESIAHSCGPDIYKEISEQIQEIKETSAHDICKHTFQMLQHCREVTREQLLDIASDQFRKLTQELKKEFRLIHQTHAMQNCRCNENSQAYASTEGLVDHSGNDRCLDKMLKKKLEKIKHKEQKFNSINHVEQEQPRRVYICKRKNSKTLPSRKSNSCKYTGSFEHERIESIDTLKPEEKHLISRIVEKCKTGGLKDVETLTNGLSKECKLLRVYDSAGYCAIHYAAERNDEDTIPIVQNLTFHGVRVSDQTKYGKTVLHIACKNGNMGLCKYILSKDPEILNVEDKYGWNAALYAAYYEQIDVMKFLIVEYPKFHNKSSLLNVNILHLACQVGHLELSAYIMSTFPFIIHDVDKEERTLVHYVARGGNTKILDYLLQKLHVRKPWKKFQQLSRGKRNPLQISCLYGHTEMSREIISKFPRMLHATDADGLHALHYAAVGGNVEVLILLMEFLDDKVRDYIKSSKSNINVLQMACVYGRVSVVEFLIEKFPSLLSELDSTDKWNIGHIAARSGNTDVLKILVENNLELIKDVDKLERNVLHIGCLYSKYNVCNYLITAFPEMINQRDVDGCRPVILAAWAGNIHILKLLLENDTKNKISTDKFTILDAAKTSSKCNDLIIDFIMDNYPELQSSNGKCQDDFINNVENLECCEMEYLDVLS